MQKFAQRYAFCLFICRCALVIFIFLSTVVATLADSAAPRLEYGSRIWQAEDNLPHNLVQAVAQTRDGYLWVGTHEGLARFDGIQFTPFDVTNAPSIKNASITALCAAHDGALWIGTESNGLLKLKDGDFTPFTKSDGLAGDFIRALHEGRDGTIWIATGSGLSRYRDGKFLNFTRRQGLLSDIVSSVYEDAQGIVWVATAGGINRLENGKATDFPGSKQIPRSPARGIIQDAEGALWFGSNNGAIKYFNGKVSFFTVASGLSHSFVSSFGLDAGSNLWVGTYGGLNRRSGDRFVSELRGDGTPYDQANTLLKDRENNVWVGSKEGLIRFTPKRFSAYTMKEGLTHNNVMSMLEDRNGAWWIGTWGAGLDQFRDGKFSVFNTSNGLSHDMVLAMCKARDGSIWAGTDFEGGLNQFADGRITHYTSKQGLIGAAIRVLHEDKSGNLWIGTSKGVSCFRNGTFTNYTTKENLAGDLVRAICEDHNGTLWFGTDGGLSQWQNGTFTNFTTGDGLSHKSIMAIYEDAQHDLWIGTQGGGLDRMRDGKFKVYNTKQGLFSDEVFEILEDDFGYFWMSCVKGIFRVKRSNFDALDADPAKMLNCISYGRGEGLMSIQCNGVAKPAAWKAHDGRLWFATTKGVIAIDPNSNNAEAVPPVFIEDLLVDRRAINLKATAESSKDTVLEIPPGRGELEFHYTALGFRVPEKNCFKYQLEGADSDWIDAGTRRFAHYNNIYPGTYHFRVRACNSDGIWNETGASLAIVLQPHVWETLWFRVLVAVLAIGIVGGTARHFTKVRMQRKLELLEQQHAIEKERSRIAQDMHDEVGARLTEIMLMSDRAQDGKNDPDKAASSLSRISTTARAVVDGLDALVWTVNPKNDSLDNLANYLCEYAQGFLEASGIQCRFDVPGELPHIPLSSEVRHNVLLVVKEALNNAAKHSRATEVSLGIQVDDEALRVSIEDNGRGFDQSVTSSRGNGLQNMDKRMRNIGGTLELSSEPGKGTRIRLQIPLKRGAARLVAS